MRKEIHIVLRKTPKPSLPHVWADMFMEIRTEHSQGLPADLSEDERTEIMDKIRGEVGMKACWREFLKRSGWTDELFDDWWESTSEKKFDEFCDSYRKDSNQKIMEKIMFAISILFGMLIGHMISEIICLLFQIS